VDNEGLLSKYCQLLSEHEKGHSKPYSIFSSIKNSHIYTFWTSGYFSKTQEENFGNK